MGIPAFFSWLSNKYPKIIVNSIETTPPVDATKSNPNFQEFDNLYLDLNGIIHPCTHPENEPQPKNEDEIFTRIFNYIDRIFAIVRPRHLVYVAIDGVAPLAKMIHQRSGRFRASKEAAKQKEKILCMRRKLENEGIVLPPPKNEEEIVDRNCITPGTQFMARLALAIRYYVHLRINHNPAWKNLAVIVSDANVPGEGEHKIMDFIRRQRASPLYDPNTAHCLCGADADLIMLGLATHEANVSIIREVFVPGRPRPCELCEQFGHDLEECQGLNQEPDFNQVYSNEKSFIFIRISVLREYLEHELRMPNLQFTYDFERAIDDWVFMCFFLGNDFLPRLPSMDTRRNAANLLINLYKEMIRNINDWLTDNGDVNLKHVQIVMAKLGKLEDQILEKRQTDQLRSIEQQRLKQFGRQRHFSVPDVPKQHHLIYPRPRSQSASFMSDTQPIRRDYDQDEENQISNETSEKTNILSSSFGPTESVTSMALQETTEDYDFESSSFNDNVFEADWKVRYYQMKFGTSNSGSEFRHKAAHAYAEGLCWVLKYYYQGCPSWSWYYPYHYAPLASDLDTIEQFKPNFPTSTKPFKPLEQLMGLFPAISQSLIPKGWRSLMTSKDSPIIDFYIPNFEINGLVFLPFIDGTRLLDALNKVYDKLTLEEKARNICGPARIVVGNSHPLFNFLFGIYKDGKNKMRKTSGNQIDWISNPVYEWIKISLIQYNRISGLVAFDPTACPLEENYITNFRNCKDFPDIKNNQCILTAYRDPQFSKYHKFLSNRLKVKELNRVLQSQDQSFIDSSQCANPYQLTNKPRKWRKNKARNRKRKGNFNRWKLTRQLVKLPRLRRNLRSRNKIIRDIPTSTMVRSSEHPVIVDDAAETKGQRGSSNFYHNIPPHPIQSINRNRRCCVSLIFKNINFSSVAVFVKNLYKTRA